MSNANDEMFRENSYVCEKIVNFVIAKNMAGLIIKSIVKTMFSILKRKINYIILFEFFKVNFE